jgi:hypothetical protein
MLGKNPFLTIKNTWHNLCYFVKNLLKYMFAGEFVNHEIGTMYKKSTAQAAKDAFIIIYRRPLANLLYGLAVR